MVLCFSKVLFKLKLKFELKLCYRSRRVGVKGSKSLLVPKPGFRPSCFLCFWHSMGAVSGLPRLPSRASWSTKSSGPAQDSVLCILQDVTPEFFLHYTTLVYVLSHLKDHGACLHSYLESSLKAKPVFCLFWIHCSKYVLTSDRAHSRYSTNICWLSSNVSLVLWQIFYFSKNIHVLDAIGALNSWDLQGWALNSWDLQSWYSILLTKKQRRRKQKWFIQEKKKKKNRTTN